MNTEKIKTLLEKYEAGETTAGEESELREFFRRPDIPAGLKSWQAQFDFYEEMRATGPGADFDPFEQITVMEEGGRSGETDRRAYYRWSLRIAAGILLILTGFVAGMVADRSPAGSEEVAALRQEVDQMKQVLLNTYQQQSSASERISMINLSTGLSGDNRPIRREIQDILIYSMNNDESVNVRIASAEALFTYGDEPRVREALVRSLPRQDEPVMQIALVNMLVELNEKGAINEMQKLLLNSDTRDVVRPMLEMGIAELKTI